MGCSSGQVAAYLRFIDEAYSADCIPRSAISARSNSRIRYPGLIAPEHPGKSPEKIVARNPTL